MRYRFLICTLKRPGSYAASILALVAVVSVLADLAEGEPKKENLAGQQFVEALCQASPDDDLLEQTFSLLEGSGSPPDPLVKHRSVLRDARAGLKDNKHLIPVLRKLSLFALTSRQIVRIIYPDTDGPHAFGGRTISAADVAHNPYLLSESYVPATEQEKESVEDLDREQRTDGPIDYFTIDIGMFPAKAYIEQRGDLQNLTVASPERLRAFAIEALKRYEAMGHSFAPLTVLLEEAEAHPLFYRDRIVLSEAQFLSADHLAHFRQRLHVRALDGQHFYYIQETKDAEEIVARFVNERVSLGDLKVDLGWLDEYLNGQAAEIAKDIAGFDAVDFRAERRRLMEDALRRRFYCVTGRPGSGKTQALHALIDRLNAAGETALVLAPTGKAALRLNGEAPSEAQWKAETIDRWLHRSGLGSYLYGLHSLAKMSRRDRYEATDNIVIDEMSMVDLPHLALIFRALEVNQPGAIKRVILVGDENQLPPIGCGRPFHDILAYLREDSGRQQNNLVRLTTNCRQQDDKIVLDAAHLFADKNRYYNDLYEQLLVSGRISPSLNVGYWEDAAQLQEQVREFIDGILADAVADQEGLSTPQLFNKLLGLYEKGFVPNANAQELTLDQAQLLTPYRAGPSGSLGLSDFVRNMYRGEAWSDRFSWDTAFAHSDKIIRLSNYYCWNPREKRRDLRLSNGSIGVICNHKSGRKAYFPESERPLIWKYLNEEDFELAYAITVHKAQGSEFQQVLVVLPERRALLSRELVYTALTRSKTQLTLLIKKTPPHLNPLKVARERSDLLRRNSSIFEDPFDSRRILEPEQGIKVKSKIEYLIYCELQQQRSAGKLKFAYEEPLSLPIDGRTVPIKPDFTIWCDGKTFYWEHLGMLDHADYSSNWKARFGGYQATNNDNFLVTTDDLSGIRQERLHEVVNAIVTGNLGGDRTAGFSLHHYSL